MIPIYSCLDEKNGSQLPVEMAARVIPWQIGHELQPVERLSELLDSFDSRTVWKAVVAVFAGSEAGTRYLTRSKRS